MKLSLRNLNDLTVACYDSSTVPMPTGTGIDWHVKVLLMWQLHAFAYPLKDFPRQSTDSAAEQMRLHYLRRSVDWGPRMNTKTTDG